MPAPEGQFEASCYNPRVERFLRRLTHALLVLTWLAGSALVGLWYRPLGVAMLAVGVVLFFWAYKRGAFSLRRTAENAVNTERDAKVMVTQVLRELTRVQVSYLCQTFDNRAEGKAWLKQALPRIFHPSLDELHSNLENARLGNEVPSLRLANAILALRDHIQALDKALDRAKQRHPEHQPAHPVVFVITDHLHATSEAEPKVITLAGWNPLTPALLPRVDMLTLVSEGDQGKIVRGQASFAAALAALGELVRPVEEETDVFVAQPVDDPARHGVALDKVPLGFVIGAAEFL